jgi:hypothetical protein
MYFFLTAFFLIFVPFSKISHYLYYPITRYYFGKSMGYRGVYPIRMPPRSEMGKATNPDVRWNPRAAEDSADDYSRQ